MSSHRADQSGADHERRGSIDQNSHRELGEAAGGARACSGPPPGQARWTMRLLAERLVELEVVESIDPATVWRTLKKTTSSRG